MRSSSRASGPTRASPPTKGAHYVNRPSDQQDSPRPRPTAHHSLHVSPRFALKYKDRLPLHRLAMVMRTSVKELTTTYGIPQDDSNRQAFLAARAFDK